MSPRGTGSFNGRQECRPSGGTDCIGGIQLLQLHVEKVRRAANGWMIQLRALTATEWIRLSGTGVSIGFPANPPWGLIQVKDF